MRFRIVSPGAGHPSSPLGMVIRFGANEFFVVAVEAFFFRSETGNYSMIFPEGSIVTPFFLSWTWIFSSNSF